MIKDFLAAIHPQNGDKYSPNLQIWLRNHLESWRRRSLVYRDSDGTLFIGSFYKDGDFGGSLLIDVLCKGNKAGGVAWRGLNLSEIANFWEKYQVIGRCAIDIHHSMSFVGDKARWKTETDGLTRSCQWCGNCVQTLQQWTEPVERQAWRNVP